MGGARNCRGDRHLPRLTSSLLSKPTSTMPAPAAHGAPKLKAELGKDNKNLQVSIDEHEKVIDDFSGTPTFLSSSARAAL